MSCSTCQQSWFWQKIGRCMRCVYQLVGLSMLSAAIWWLAFRHNPKSIESIALLTAIFAFSGLLTLHLWMRWFVLPLQSRKRKESRN
ncbi:DUF3624 domain-containing protein [Vibrio renipiscarius]|uniref:DUF3624 domain-containing protein n=1 Tax=Vibrio renipiscarius TaxID=1461322 RepID=UPI000595E53F|nr:DUF3624 domain-containing protein [Vibrio renipiscarius]KII81546.1 membrane protein [Vibrio renipiscarius]